MSRYKRPAYRYVLSANGVVAANNFLTLTNPANSGAVVAFALDALHVRCGSVGPVTLQPPMIVSRATGVSGGTLVNSATSVTRYRTASPAPAAELRTGNPTATVGTPFVLVHSIESTGAATPVGVEFNVTLDDVELAEGESLVFRTSAGDVDQRWIIGFTWKESIT